MPGDRHRNRKAVPGGGGRARGPRHDRAELDRATGHPGMGPDRLGGAGPGRASAIRYANIGTFTTVVFRLPGLHDTGRIRGDLCEVCAYQ